MAQLTGIGGRIESITKRNPTQRSLGVVVHAFEKECTVLGINGIPWFEDLQKHILQFSYELSELQGKKWDKERQRADILALENRLSDAFLDFARGVLRVTHGGIEIISLIDPAFPTNGTDVETQARLNDPTFTTQLRVQSRSLSDVLMTSLDQKVGATQSIDFSRTFALLKQLHERYKAEKPRLAQLDTDIAQLDRDITAKDAEKATKELLKSKLDPLYNDMKKLEAKGNKTTAISRVANMAAWAALALGVYTTTTDTKPPSLPLSAVPVAALTQTNAIIVFGHSIQGSGNTLEIAPSSNGVVKVSDGSEFQFTLHGNTRTFNHKIAWGNWVDGVAIPFTGNSGDIIIGSVVYSIVLTSSSIKVTKK